MFISKEGRGQLRAFALHGFAIKAGDGESWGFGCSGNLFSIY
jgi:hypothetical protein